MLSCVSAQEDDMREMLHNTYNISPSVADLLMSYEGSSADSLSSEVCTGLSAERYVKHHSLFYQCTRMCNKTGFVFVKMWWSLNSYFKSFQVLLMNIPFPLLHIL